MKKKLFITVFLLTGCFNYEQNYENLPYEKIISVKKKGSYINLKFKGEYDSIYSTINLECNNEKILRMFFKRNNFERWKTQCENVPLEISCKLIKDYFICEVLAKANKDKKIRLKVN
jgi:hypothetical protein